MPPDCQPGLYGPALERLNYPKGFGAIAAYDTWAANKKEDEQWMYAFFMGRSALRACSDETDPDTWAKSIGLVGDYAANADFDGKYAAYSACKKKDLVGSCNINCNGVANYCSSNCVDLFNSTEDGPEAPKRNGWLWDYVLKDGGGGSTKQYECQGPALPTPSPSGTPSGNTSSRRLFYEKPRSRLLNSSSNSSNSPSPSRTTNPSISPSPGVVPCPESKHTSKNCTCPAGQTNTEIQRSNDPRDFVSDPDGKVLGMVCIVRTRNELILYFLLFTGKDYKKACSFNFTRMVTPYVNEKENKDYIFNGTICHGKAVYSIAYTNDVVRYILIGGVAFKMFSIVLLYIAACTTPKNESRRDNLKLSLCLATPGGCWYVCECNKCRSGEKGKGKEIVKETLKNAAYRPEVTGCLAFTSLLGDIGLTMGLFIMCLGVSPIDSAPQWSGVFLGLGSVLNNIRGNLKTKYKAKQKLYVLCPVPWPTYVEPYPGAKYGMPKPDENGKFFWEEGTCIFLFSLVIKLA